MMVVVMIYNRWQWYLQYGGGNREGIDNGCDSGLDNLDTVKVMIQILVILFLKIMKVKI